MYHRYTSTIPTAIPRKGREHIAVLCGGSCLFCCPCSAPATETISQENQTWTIGDKRRILPAPADRVASDTYRTHTRTPKTPLEHCCAQWRFCCFWSPSNRKQIYCRYTLACERSLVRSMSACNVVMLSSCARSNTRETQTDQAARKGGRHTNARPWGSPSKAFTPLEHIPLFVHAIGILAQLPARLSKRLPA